MTPKPTRPEGLLDRIELAAVHLRAAAEELEHCANIAGRRFTAARSQLQGSERQAALALEAAEQAKTTIVEATVPLAEGIRKKRPWPK